LQDCRWKPVAEDRPGPSNPEKRPTIRLPASWAKLIGKRSGAIRLTRRFHQPTNLAANDEIAVVSAGFPGQGTLAVNGTHVADFSAEALSVHVAITTLLKSVNVLVVEFEIPSGPINDPEDVPWGDVSLEIRGT
jgi:hypothetical protein